MYFDFPSPLNCQIEIYKSEANFIPLFYTQSFQNPANNNYIVI